MKKITLLLVTFAFTANMMATDLFYTDFATTPADLVAFTATSNKTYTPTSTPALPISGATWEAGGLSQIKFSPNNTAALSVTTMTIADPVADNTPIGTYGRVSLNATGDYIKVKSLQGPFTVILYVATQTDPYTTPETKVIMGTTETTYSYDGLKLIKKKTFEYAGNDIVDVTVIQTKSGCNIFDIKVISGVSTGFAQATVENPAYMSGNKLLVSETADIELFSMNGSKVASIYNSKELSCAGISKGIYFTKIRTNGNQSTQKIVIQ